MASDPLQCSHPDVPTPEFDECAGMHSSARHVRLIWPPTRATCPDCTASVVRWASYAHVLSGAWQGPPDAATDPPTALIALEGQA